MNLNATLLIEILSFLVLLGLLIKFLYRPLLKILDQRAQEVETANRQLSQSLQLAEQQREQAEKMLTDSKQAALKIKEQVLEDAERTRRKMNAQAKDEAAKILRSSQEELAGQIKQARAGLESEIIALSVKAAEKILRRKFSAQDQKQLIEELTEEIS